MIWEHKITVEVEIMALLTIDWQVILCRLIKNYIKDILKYNNRKYSN